MFFFVGHQCPGNTLFRAIVDEIIIPIGFVYIPALYIILIVYYYSSYQICIQIIIIYLSNTLYTLWSGAVHLDIHIEEYKFYIYM